MLKLVFTLCCFVYISQNGNTQQTPDSKLIAQYDSLLTRLFNPGEPGGAVIVTRNGKTIFHKAYGIADLELNVPMEKDMVFRIGSITKQFTAIAILKLAEQGKISLKDDIKKYIPDFSTYGRVITIEHLLTHTSGIKSYTSLEIFDSLLRNDLKPFEVIDLFKNEQLEFEPGEKWSYNNSGYFLLGYIIEKISGNTYEQFIEENIFAPAGMTNSAYDNPNQIVNNRAKGYGCIDNKFENASYISMTLPYAAGSLISTVEDLSKWNQALNNYKIISKTWLDKAHTEFKLNNGKSSRFGYGWLISEVQGSPSFDHGGAISGFTSEALYLPEEEVYIAILTNCICYSPEEALIKMAALSIGKPYIMKELSLNAEKANEYAGIYENENGERISIKINGNKLIWQRGDGNPDRIIPFSYDKFYLESKDLLTIHFSRDESADVYGLQFRSRLEISDWKKIQ